MVSKKINNLRIILILFAATIPALVKSQGYFFYDDGHYEPSWVFEISANFGVLNAVTDIGGSKSGKTGLQAYNLRSPLFSGGISFSGTFKDVLALRVEFNGGKIEASDSLLKGATHFSAIGRYQRNLSFRTPVFEGFFAGEFHPLFIKDYTATNQKAPKISPFGMVGIGFVSFRPQAYLNGNWVELKPLRLEGQGFEEYPDRKQYSTIAGTLVAGLGLRYEINRLLAVRLELEHRWTSTDYLDDVSQEDWVDPTLFSKYLPSGQANMAQQLYNRSIDINPPRNTRPRGDRDRLDNFWGFNFRLAFALNRNRQ